MAKNNKTRNASNGIKFELPEKKKGNAIDLLLDTDINKFDRVSKKIKMERLSEIIGTDFIVELKEILPTIDANIQKLCINTDVNGKVDIDLRKLQNMTIVEGVLYEGGYLFRNKDLKEKFNAANPFELLEKLTTKNEREKLYMLIDGLGSRKDMFTEVKN